MRIPVQSYKTSYLQSYSRLVACAVLSIALATPASAQLGKLKKIASDAAKDAATGKKPDPAASAGLPGAKIDYAVTDERLTAIMSVLAPMADEARRESEARKVRAGYEAKSKAFTECLNKSAQGATPDAMAMGSAKGEALTAKMSTYIDRATKAQQAKRWREYVANTDSSLVTQMAISMLMMPSAKCGVMPNMPPAMIEASARHMEQSSSGVSQNSLGSDELVVPAEKRAGMTSGQFGRIRETIAIWLLIQSGDLPANTHKFTDAEQAVLSAKSTELKMYAPLFKDGVMRWATWGDIKSW